MQVTPERVLALADEIEKGVEGGPAPRCGSRQKRHLAVLQREQALGVGTSQMGWLTAPTATPVSQASHECPPHPERRVLRLLPR